MTRTEIADLTDAQIAKAIADIGDHPLAERFEDELHNRQSIAARDEFRKVRCVLPNNPEAHPMSGRAGEY